MTTNEIIGLNLKQIRQERNLTLDDLARLTGVSKSMISEIERCTKSPTISVLEKICDGIHVSISQLTLTSQPQITLVRNDTVTHYSAWEGFELFALFEFDPNTRFEIFRHEIAPHAQRFSEPHEVGIREYIICTKGEFCIIIEEEKYYLQQGEAIQFLANSNHIYSNPTEQETDIVMVLYHE
jgi:transcriptional regulator with XRE-family HTH domain